MRIARRGLLTAVAALAATTRARGGATALEAALDALCRRASAARSAAGLAIRVQRHGFVLYSRGFGFANIAAAARVTPDTVFRIGSVTKQFTAAAILALAEDGKLSLDDPLSRFLPDFPRAEEVQIRRLLNHTSGIANIATGVMPWVDYSMAEIVDVIRRQKPLYVFDPGTRWAYSNTAFILAGAVVERAAGMPYWEFYRRRLFARAGLTATAPDRKGDIVPNRARGYSRTASGGFGEADYLSWTIPGPAGCLRSTAVDLTTWHGALFRGRVIGPASIAEMTTPSRLKDGRLASAGRTGPAAGTQPVQEYGLGLELSRVDGMMRAGHYGSITGFAADMGTFPALGVTVAILTNTDFSAANPPRDVDRTVLSRVLR